MEVVRFSNSPDHAFVAYLVQKYNEVEEIPPLGRIILQKLCYLAKARGVPLSLHFEIHHYGPFSAELFSITDDLIADRVVDDKSEYTSRSYYVPTANCRPLLNRRRSLIDSRKPILDLIVRLFRGLPPQELELITTIHYIFCAKKNWGNPTRGSVVDTVFRIKEGKFSRQTVGATFNALRHARLLTWNPQVLD